MGGNGPFAPRTSGAEVGTGERSAADSGAGQRRSARSAARVLSIQCAASLGQSIAAAASASLAFRRRACRARGRLRARAARLRDDLDRWPRGAVPRAAACRASRCLALAMPELAVDEAPPDTVFAGDDPQPSARRGDLRGDAAARGFRLSRPDRLGDQARPLRQAARRGRHSAGELERLVCPIGLPGIGSKEPAAIAASVRRRSADPAREKLLRARCRGAAWTLIRTSAIHAPRRRTLGGAHAGRGGRPVRRRHRQGRQGDRRGLEPGHVDQRPDRARRGRAPSAPPARSSAHSRSPAATSTRAASRARCASPPSTGRASTASSSPTRARTPRRSASTTSFSIARCRSRSRSAHPDGQARAAGGRGGLRRVAGEARQGSSIRDQE